MTNARRLEDSKLTHKLSTDSRSHRISVHMTRVYIWAHVHAHKDPLTRINVLLLQLQGLGTGKAGEIIGTTLCYMELYIYLPRLSDHTRATVTSSLSVSA